MRKFKPLKELVKALTYIGDAIAGNVKTNADNSKEYDGIEVIPFPDKEAFSTFDLTIDENANFSKLGDVFSDNVINDINYIRELLDTNDFYINRKYNIHDEINAWVYVQFQTKGSNLALLYYYVQLGNVGPSVSEPIVFNVELSAPSDDLTKDTLLTKITAG